MRVRQLRGRHRDLGPLLRRDWYLPVATNHELQPVRLRDSELQDVVRQRSRLRGELPLQQPRTERRVQGLVRRVMHERGSVRERRLPRLSTVRLQPERRLPGSDSHL